MTLRVFIAFCSCVLIGMIISILFESKTKDFLKQQLEASKRHYKNLEIACEILEDFNCKLKCKLYIIEKEVEEIKMILKSQTDDDLK